MENLFFREGLDRSFKTKTSMQTLKKSLSEECLVDLHSTTHTFIPFLKERDGMNKIIPWNFIEDSPKKTRETASAYYKPTTPKLRLLTKVQII
jgi:hypothetical protein